MSESIKAFIAILCDLKLREEAIIGITEIVWENYPLMDKIVDYIEQNPRATESEILHLISFKKKQQ